jgi:hypothetical protein
MQMSGAAIFFIFIVENRFQTVALSNQSNLPPDSKEPPIAKPVKLNDKWQPHASEAN